MSTFTVYLLAIGANLSFSTSSMIFTNYAKRFSSFWMNQTKVTIATIAFFIAMVMVEGWAPVSIWSLCFLLTSGLMGLCIGDLFLFRAFSSLGPGRTLVLFSFQPLYLGLYGYLFLGQIFSADQGFSVLCMILCLFTFIRERTKDLGFLDLRSFMYAFLGISLDAIGVMLTRSAYELSPEVQTFQANFIRCMAALLGFILIRPKSFKQVFKDIGNLKPSEKSFLIGSCLMGTFLSLTMYLKALKFAHTGTLTALSITGPVWVSLLDCVIHRKFPSRYLTIAFSFFLMGFYLMLRKDLGLP